jgi:nicotinate-nucleotide pyrophosphorylase
MAPTATKKTTKTTTSSKAGRKSDSSLDLTSPPPKKAKGTSTTTPKSYNILATKPYTVNQFPSDDHDKIHLVLHEGGLPGKSAQPIVTLQGDGMHVHITWKVKQQLFTDLQAIAQGISTDSAQFASYNNNMQIMKKDGVTPTDGYITGEPQIVRLQVKCVGFPLLKRMAVPTGET